VNAFPASLLESLLRRLGRESTLTVTWYDQSGEQQAVVTVPLLSLPKWVEMAGTPTAQSLRAPDLRRLRLVMGYDQTLTKAQRLTLDGVQYAVEATRVLGSEEGPVAVVLEVVRVD